MDIIISTLIVFLLIPVFKYFHHQKKLFSYGRQLPGPEQFLFIAYKDGIFKNKGKILNKILLKIKLIIPEFYDIIFKQCSNFSTLFKIWCFNSLIVVVTDPKKCRAILNDCVTKPEKIKLFSPAFGNGLFVLGGYKWAKRRKLLNNSFSIPKISNYFETFQKYSQAFVSTLAENTKNEVDVYPLLRCNSSSLIIGKMTNLGLYIFFL